MHILTELHGQFPSEITLSEKALDGEIQKVLWKPPPYSICDLSVVLAKAVSECRVDIVRSILSSERFSRTVNANSILCHGTTPLLMAAQVGDINMVEMLLSMDAKVDGWSTVFRSNDYPLSYPCDGQHRLHELLAFASSYEGDSSGHSWEILPKLLKREESRYVLKGASMRGLQPSKEELDRCYQARTPLMAAAEKGHLDVVKLLVEIHGADTRIVAPDGEIALRLAHNLKDKGTYGYLRSRPSNTSTSWQRLYCMLFYHCHYIFPCPYDPRIR
jgi:hypothetical protein